MLAESVIGIVRAVNGLLEKVNVQGQASLVKSGARLEEGDVLTLLSGEAYIQFINGFPEALALEKPVKLDGVSPTLQYGAEDLKEQMVQEAIAKGIDPSVILDVLGSAAAGAEAVGSGGDAFIMDPLFGFGHVTAGYPTGPISFAYEADTQQLFWFVPEETGAIAESELTQEPESIPQIPQFTTNQAVLTVFEDALPSGIADSAGQARIASSSLSSLLTSSADVAASFAFNSNLSALPTLKSGGIDLSYELSADKRTLTLRESSTQGPGAEVMKLELTADGQLTQTLMNSIDHPAADSDDGEWMRFDLSPLIDVTFTRTSNGTVLESRTLPANAVVAGIQDDVPIARAQLTNNEILLDETIGMKVGDADAANDDFNPTTTVDPFNNIYGTPLGLVQNANLLDASTSEMGGDYKNATMTHLLKITDAVSGLQTTDGTPINLFLESNGDITGRAGDVGAPAVFAIRMNPNTGAISVAQYGPIKQFDTNSHDEAVDLTGRISAVVTAKDSDGDESNAEIPIGQLIIFADDGPSVAVNVGNEAGILLTTQDADTIGTATDAAVTSANFGNVFSNTPNYGADGAGSTVMSYSLGLIAASGADSGLDSNGSNIYLYDISGTIVGSTSATQAGVNAGNTVFDLSVDGAGVVTLRQYAEIDHPIADDPSASGAPFDDQLAVLGNNLVSLTATALTTDGDGDTATASERIDLGGNVRFADDGPSVAVNVGNEAGILLTTQDADTIGTATDAAVTSANFGNVFSNTPNYGADGAGSTVMSYSLGLIAASGADSGLDSNGSNIYLYDISGTIVGSTSATQAGVNAGNTVFDLSVDGAGVVTLRQYAEIDHPIADDPSASGAPFDDQLAVLGNNLVSLTATALTTDGDGDTATASERIDLGGNVRFADDGPSVAVNVGNEAGILLTTQDADTIGTATDAAVTSANFGNVFSNTPNYGADGAGSTVMSYSLGLIAASGADSGLDSNGSNIYLYDISGTIVGSTSATQAGVNAGNTVFDLSVDGAGVVTLRQYAEIDHPIADDPSASGAPFDDQLAVLGNNLVSLTATALTTDGDGDTATASERIDLGGNVRFADDGPSVAVNVGNEAGILLTTQDADTIGTATDAAVTSANFGNVFSNTPNYGADGAGSTVMSYSLGLIAASGADSGLDSNGSNIYLYDISGTIVGSTSATQAGVNAGNTVFDLSVDGAGVVTLRQYAEIDHPIADDPSASGAPFDDQLAVLGNNLVSLTATALTTDGDGDTATASERIDLGGNVRFADDGPSVAVNVGNEAGILLTTQDADTIGTATDAAVTSANFGNVFSNTPNYGADGAGSTVMSYSLGLIAASGADSGLDSNGSNIYLYDISGTIVGSTSATQAGVNAGNTVFDLSVDGAGVVTLRQYAEIDHPIADDPSASGAPFDDQLAVLGNNLVSLTATALTTDGDGDTATASERIDLGGNVRFADDGPSVAVNVGNEAGILLTTQDADTIGTATDAAVTSANFGNVFSNTPNYGADGAGSTVMSYSLGLIAASGADSGLDSNGSNIYLYDISGTIVGSTSATQAGVNAGNTVFDLSVDGAGVVTLRQYAEIDHPIADDPSASGAPFDDQLAVLGNNLVSLTATALTTDGDGDTATASERIDLGGNVRFADDGPSVAVNVGNEAGILLTTQDADTIGTATDAAVTSANFGNVFSNTPNYGADGAGSTVMSYSLGLIAASGADSGLDSNGSNIYLYDISGTIVGSTSATQAGVNAGNTVFDLSVDGAGVVTLRQYAEIDHPIADDPSASGAPFDDQLAVLGNNLVSLTATALTTDGDGDTATASERIDLGGNVRFADDGPSVAVNVGNEAGILLTTQDADTIGTATDAAVTSANFGNVFSNTPNYGADGAGSTVMSYSLGLIAASGADSGLDSNGSNIYLYDISGTIVGSTSATQAGVNAGNTVFDLSVDGAGVVTLRQYAEIDHPIADDPSASGAPFDDQLAVLGNNLVSLTATALTTDGDGDTATASERIDLGGNVRFADDGPSVTMTVSDNNVITLNTQDADTIGAASDSDSVSFAAAFAVTPNYGADGAGTTVTTYALSVSAQGVDSGLDNNGNNIYLYNIAGSVVGSTSATQAGITTGNTIFSLGVNSGSGVVTLTQHQEVDHGLPGASSNYAAQEAILNTGLVFLNATAVTTDGDGDTATASASLDLGGNVKFDDDGPSVTMTVSDTNAITLNTQDADTIGAASDSDSVSFAAAFAVTPNYGADGAGTTVTTYALSVSAQGVDSGLDNNGNNIYLYNIAGSVVGSTSATQAGITTGNTIFSLGVNSGSGVVTLTQHQEVDHGLPGASSNYAAQEAILNTGLVFLNATAVTTDGDGDTATASASLDLGGNVKFDDDGPSVTMTVSDNNVITLNTQDADTIGAASDSDSVSFAAAFAVTPNYGADGAGTTVTTYALSVSAQGVDSGLDNNGNNIYLYNIAGSVVGSTSATQAGITTGNTIFSLGVNSSSGVVTLTQHQEVDHGLPGASSNYAAQEAILNTGLVFLNATAVTTDGDGDTATASASLDLGGNVKFDDDGPSVTMTVSDTNAITLNTQDADTIGAASDSDSVSFAAAFAVTPNYGADGAGTTVTTYALSVSAQGVDSGLDNNGNNIYLYNIAGSVVGSTSATQAGITTGNTIFSLGVNSSSGVVTLTQHQEVDHGLPGASSNYAAQEAILNTGLVFLNATAVTTDGDGDTATASASLDLGGNVKFDDDGPSVTMTVSDTNAITLNTQDADTIGAASDSDSASFAAAFAVTPNYGADGAGTTVTTYALSVSAQGVDSGLDNNGNNIYLYNIAGSVVGSTSATQAGITTGNTIFSLGVNSSSGVVTLTQHQEVDHGLPGASSNYAAQEAILNTGLVFLNATAVTTDGDGDTATASASLDLGGNVKFDDDGPSVTMTVSDTNAITLNTQDADTIGAASDSDSASFAAAFAVTPNYGADGAGTTVTTYALSVSAQGVDSGLDNNGNNIYLYNIAGSVVGSTSATQAGITTGNTIFSLGVNSGSGVVTLTQHQEVDHGLPGASSNYAAQEAILNTGLVFLNATAVTTDRDGDTATASASLDLGGNVKFDDDGPSVTMTVSDNNVITLNTQDADTIGAASDSDSVSFAAAFAVTPNYGADGAGTTVTTYALSVSAQGVDSGLDNNGNNIYLYNIAGSVVGSTSATQAGITTGNTIFSLGVNSGSGVVTLTQHQEVDHGLPGASSNYAAQEAILNTGLVFLNATAVTTDGDGDTATASASLDLGGNVKFDDDGPSVTMTVSDNNVITLNTQDADTIGAASDSDSVSFAAAFAVTPNYGADGAGTTVTTYALSVSAQGVDSGLDNNGNNIYLYNIAGSVVGSTSATQAGITTGNTIFSLGVNSSSGVVTLTQHQEVDHGLPGASSNYAAQEAILNTGLVFLNATAVTTDGDGDTATASASLDLGGNVKFDDDGPSVTMTVSDTNAITLNTQDADTIGAASDSDSVSFAAAFAVTPNYGADGAGTTVTTYALSVSAQGVDSGLDNNGNNIYLYNIAGSVVGSTSATQAGITTGNTIFSLGVNSSSGVVTLTQHQEVDHGLPGASSNYAAQEAILNTGLVFLNATAVTTDGDGDTATASASLDLGGNVKFDDDGPSVTMTVSDNNVITLNTQDADTIGAASDSDSASFAAAFAVTPNYGADGAGTTVTTYALSVSAQGVDSGLDNNGNNIYLYNIAGSVVGSTSATQAGITTGNTIFSLGVNSSSGVVTLTQHQEVDHGLPGASSNYAAQEAILNTGLVFLNATAVTTDGDGDTATASASLDLGGNVKFDDDGPVASNITRSGLANEGADTNLMLILDTSGSMAGSGIQTLINSTLELLERYEALGNVKVRIVTFNTSATAIGSVWMTVDAAKNALLGLTAGGNTNFDAALITAMNAFNSGTVGGADGRIGGAQNVSYFISDGNPTVNQDWPSIPGTLAQNGIQPSEQAAWEAFLQDTNGASAGGEKIRSYALGMGTGITVSNLEPIGFNGVNGTDIPAVVVTDISQLDSVLASTITASPISGTLISDPNPGVNFGADGGHVQSVTVNGITYTVNANLSSLSTSGSATQGSNTHSYDNSTHVLTVTISTGESLTIDMDNGSYTFTPPANITSSINRIINYVLVDGDGDTAAATITFNIDISGFNDPLVVRDDLVLTNQPAVSGQDVISIPTWALLANDSGGSGVSTVSSVTQPAAEGTVVLNPGSVAFTEESNSAADGTYNGSTSDPFRYTNTTGSQSATAKVDLDRAQAGENTLDGTYRSEILLGRDTSNDTIIGNDGNDILIGLGGNDTLSGGNGDDILAGGAGNDTLDGGAGNDTATYIDATAGVTVSLNTSSAQNTVGAGTDKLTNIENLTGSKFNDTLTGNNSANTIKGLEGNDTISGLGGNDTLDGGSGDDVIIGGLGDDILTGGSGADQFVLVKGQGGASAGAAPIDTITDFEVNIDKIVINGNNITGVSVSTPVSNTYTITVNYSDAATEHFKVTLSNGALLNDSGKTHLNGVVISGGTATIDGTIVGAVLYMDLNANNQEDEGERLGITDQYGHVEWVVDLSKFDVNGDGQYVIGEARAVQTGGFDIDTGLSYEINLYGPVGSAVISPLTSLLQAQLEAGMDYETANAALVARLGLPEGTQIISFNPITGSGEVLAQNAGVMTAAIQFAEIAAIHYSTDEGHVSFAVFEAISKALLELPEGVVADFGDEGFLQSIANYLGLDALVTSDMIDYMATSQKALEASILTLAPGEDALTAISKIQHVTQGIYAQAIEMALIGYLPLDALKNMSAVLKAYADGDITDEQLNSFEDKLSAVIVNWEDNNVTDTSHQATLQTERTVDDSSVKSEVNHEMAQEVNAVINDFMDEHNISLYYYDQQAQMPQETQEQQPTEDQAEETVMHDDVVQDLLLDDHSLTMLANNPQLNGGNGNDVLHGTTGNDFIRGGQGNDTMTGGGGVDTFFWLSGDDDGGVDTITDFKANPVDQSSDASVLNLSDLLSDADLETNSLDNYLNVSTTEEGDTAIKVDPNGNGNFDAPAQTIILEDVDLTAVFATNNSHDIVNQMIANGNLIVEQ
ncbi:enhanced entry virulence factor RtxA [Legionella pneumophila]|uniref:enhanced entry virulence factor RtxA n=4 Tax=Legionella pneumophila TaxID=446 RepID=UPI0024C86C6E|nr:Bifunctional hemolysin/adenylate cyclase precursor [Legionella pneumophila]